MPRGRRELYDGAVYHVVQRGHNKDTLFKRRRDYLVFKEFIRKYKFRNTFDIYHYCLMPNHFHFLLKIMKGAELPKILHGISQTYSHYYRKVYNRSGHVYQNRYKSYLIEDDGYLLECGRYIDRNPLRAGIVKNLPDYSWSSYNFYGNGQADDLLTVNPLYTGMGKTDEERRNSYRKYIVEARPYEKLIDKAMVD